MSKIVISLTFVTVRLHVVDNIYIIKAIRGVVTVSVDINIFLPESREVCQRNIQIRAKEAISVSVTKVPSGTDVLRAVVADVNAMGEV